MHTRGDYNEYSYHALKLEKIRRVYYSYLLEIFQINPYKPSVLFVGHRQTVHNAASDQDLHCFINRMSFQNLNGIETYYPTTLKFEIYLSN